MGWMAVRLLAEGPDDRFIDIYNLIQQADQSLDRGSARPLYEQARERLLGLQRDYPTWNERVVSYRLRYTAEKLSALPNGGPEPASSSKGSTVSPGIASNGEVIQQFNEFTQQIRLLQSDKQLLEAKLREALTAQPAPIDPREFQAAIERIATLQQTNKTLTASLQLQQSERASLVDRVVLEETQKALSDANKSLNSQRDKAVKMEQERLAATAELKRLQEESVKPLSLENSILKEQVTELKTNGEKGRQVADLTERLTRLESGLRDLKQQNVTLTADKSSLEKQLDDLKTRSAEEGIVKMAQLESQLAVAQTESARQTARVEDISARLAQERQAKSELQTRNDLLARRVADLTANTASDAEVKLQLQSALAVEKAERAQAEAELKSAEQKLQTLQAAASNTLRSPGTSAQARNASIFAESELKGFEAERDKLKETIKASAQREIELATALKLEASLRQRLESEKSDLEKRLATASVQLAANRVESARTPVVPLSSASQRPSSELELRVRQLEQEREDLRGRLTRLTQSAPLALVSARMRRAVSPRERPAEFLQYRQLKAYANEPKWSTPAPGITSKTSGAAEKFRPPTSSSAAPSLSPLPARKDI